MNRYANHFVDEFPTTKTLEFKLVPVMGTAQRIKERKILEADAQLAENLKKIKATGDEFHKAFIQTVLENAVMPAHYREYCSLIKATKEEKALPSYRKDLNKCNAALKAEVAGLFQKDPCYTKLFRKEFVTELLPDFVKEREDLFFDESFKRRTTDFNDYHKTREHFYAEDGSIARRIVDDNIPKHLMNITSFCMLMASDAARCVNMIEAELSDVLNGTTLAEWFREDTLVWSQEAIDTYNAIIGGIATADRQIKGLNNYVSEYNQTHTEKLMYFSKLYKMVMSDRVRLSWLPDAFTTEDEVVKAISTFHRSRLAADNYAVRKTIHKMFTAISSEDKVYYEGKELFGLSNELFGQASVIRNAMEHYYVRHIDTKFEHNFARASEKKQEKMLAEKRRFTSPKQVSLAMLDNILSHYADECDSAEAKKVAAQYNGVQTVVNACMSNVEQHIASADETYRTIEERYGHDSFADLKPAVKKYLDSVLDIHRQLRCFSIADPSLAFDTAFYAAHDEVCESLGTCIPLYNMTRNFATKKPFSTAKTNLTFGKVGAFLGGWVDSHGAKSDNGTASGGYLFRKKNEIGEYDYYLGICLSRKLFRTDREVEEQDQSEFERLEYYQLSNKAFYGKAYTGSYKEDSLVVMQAIKAFVAQEPFDEETHERLTEYLSSSQATPVGIIKRLRSSAPDAYQHLLEDPGFSAANQELLNKLVSLISKQTRLSGTKSIIGKTYDVCTDIMADIEKLTRENRTFRYNPVSKREFELALTNEEQPLYLFKITNRDLSYAETFSKGLRKKRGREQLHTMMFKALMSGQQNTYDIGTGKVFYRPASLPERDTHPANISIRSKTKKDRTNTFKYAIQKDRRYMKDMFSLQLSIICNYSATGDTNINKEMLAYLTEHRDVNIIGVNRGEYNLLYITVIDQDGNILRDNKTGELLSYPLNTISASYRDVNGKQHTVEESYRDILDEREKQRLEERQNWEDVSKIKDIKTGYLSQVVHHLTSLMLEYNAVLVLEDLDSRFIQKRTAIDKSIYAQFEKALITKLNFFFQKDTDPNEPGGLLNPYQLTAPLKAMKDIHGQTGCIFYANPWMVTKLDPATGFADMLYVNTDAPVKTFKAFFEKMLDIRYNPEKKWFEFHFDYQAYDALMPDDIRTEWTVCTHGEFRWAYDAKLNNNRGGFKQVKVTEELAELLASEKISYENGQDIKEDILNANNRKFFVTLYKLFKLVTQMHYRVPAKDIDVLISPVTGNDGTFFRSDIAEKQKLNVPYNGDANASYNIARKALFGIHNLDPESPWFRTPGKYDWLRFVQR